MEKIKQLRERGISVKKAIKLIYSPYVPMMPERKTTLNLRPPEPLFEELKTLN